MDIIYILLALLAVAVIAWARSAWRRRKTAAKAPDADRKSSGGKGEE